ncbi:MAG: hypothetical protein IPM39_22155 [Chloroflexi bacterium]|nr:hypothetical protein [Chloroflexota bacterium]
MNIPNRAAFWRAASVSVFLALAGLLALGWLATPPAQATPMAIWYVAPGGDDANDCLSLAAACATIGAAVGKANDDDTIQIAAGLYNESQISVNKPLTFIGADAATTIVDGGGNGRIFTLNAPSTLYHLTIQNGQTPTDPNIFNSGGGGLRVTDVVVLLQNVIIKENAAPGSGGAIFNTGQLTIDQSVIISNTAVGWGGGIFNYGVGSSAITITHSLLAANSADGIYGGGLYTTRSLLVQDSIIRDNEAAGVGGGLAVGGGVVLERTTITGNRAAEGAGLIAELGDVSLRNTTVSGNIASINYSGVYAAGATAVITATNSTIAHNVGLGGGVGYNGLALVSGAIGYLQNTLVANNTQRQCNGGNLISLGHNLSSDTFCNLTQPGDQQGVDPLLMPLGDYGGPTPTHALSPGSPAIEGGSNSDCPATDQRGVARPYDGDNNGTAVCDIGAVEAEHQLIIADTSVLEGTGGMSTAVFTVTLAPASSQAVTVDYATEDGTAVAPADYTAASGTLAFAPGQTTQTINVPIVADNLDELDETFFVHLSNASNAVILIGTAVGTIIDDDGLPSLSINDVALLEGNGGTQQMSFDVTLSPASPAVVTVDYVTVNGTAVAPSDYAAVSGSLTFAPGETSKPVNVTILGDFIDEGESEQFSVQLSNPTNAALDKASGIGTITDDDTARLSHGADSNVLEGNGGLTPGVFTVTLSTPAAFVITVDYTLSSGFGVGGATAGVDFTGPFTGTVTFQPGQTTRNYTANIIGDLDVEPDEIFFSTLSGGNAPINASGSSITILNDDFEEPQRVYLPLIIR